MTWPEGGTGQVAAVAPEGQYAMFLILINEEDDDDLIYYLYSEDGWETLEYEEFLEKLSDLDMDNVIKAESGEKKEVEGPKW